MPTNTPDRRVSRHRQPYSELFRELGPDERQEELDSLKALYDQDRMSIRQIAALKRSSYGFMQARLVEADVNVGSNRASNPAESTAASGAADSAVTAAHDSSGTHP